MVTGKTQVEALRNETLFSECFLAKSDQVRPFLDHRLIAIHPSDDGWEEKSGGFWGDGWSSPYFRVSYAANAPALGYALKMFRPEVAGDTALVIRFGEHQFATLELKAGEPVWLVIPKPADRTAPKDIFSLAVTRAFHPKTTDTRDLGICILTHLKPEEGS
ncbi:hypothetical protein SAMN04488036_10626 [Shimia haliotis]|uniref:Uncharacterized protein n=1 Tax=Shimia haliotis TaxID=1280847 RepID=A0A1I4FG58_9RHOB|nr:hypothetical protein SAMN04488036_10626 [Shimia haliotis]